MEVPTHIGIIMDGNRRWAKKQGLKILVGHRQGAEALNDEVIDHALKRGVKVVTLYAFSTENWQRPEANEILTIIEEYVLKRLDSMMNRGIKLRIMGDFAKLPGNLKNALNEALEKTSANDKLVLNLCLSYDGRDELVRAVKNIVASNQEINKETISANLDSAGLPDPDLIIRTSGEQRLSGFLTWQSVYSELYFTPTLWPDFNQAELDKAINWYQERNRRFGK